MCPHCRDTRQYTDPQLRVRCVRCLNPVAGTPGTPIGRMVDDETYKPIP